MEFTHFDDQGNALMVDVGDKAETKREAVARGSIFMSPQCLEKVAQGTMAKGDVLGVARVAGIMGAKRTSELISSVPYTESHQAYRGFHHKEGEQ